MSTEPTKNNRQFWEQHVTQFQLSGLSKAQYCREHQLTYHQFIYWSPRFDTHYDDPATPVTANRFLPVKLTQSVQPVELGITLPSGVQISGVTEQTSALAVHIIAKL